MHLAFPLSVVASSQCGGLRVVKLTWQLKALSIKVLANNIEITSSFVTQPQKSASKSPSLAQYLIANRVVSPLTYKGKENKLQFSMGGMSKNLEVLF